MFGVVSFLCNLPHISDKLEHRAKLRFVSYRTCTEEKLPQNIRFILDFRHGVLKDIELDKSKRIGPTVNRTRVGRESLWV